MENGNESRWSTNLPIWVLVAIAVVIGVVVWCHNMGKDKANLSAAVQELYGRTNSQGEQLNRVVSRTDQISTTLAGSVQAQADFMQTTNKNLDWLDMAVFKPVTSCGCGCGRSAGTRTRFEKESNYILDSTNVKEIDTCGGC